MAYGSNLNVSQMRERCPGAKALGSGELSGLRLAFRGAARGYYLTVEPWPGERIPVGVWSVTPEDEARLDQYEGYPEFYGKTMTPIEYRDQKGVLRRGQGLLYVMLDGYGRGEPAEDYVQGCLEGYRDFGFDPAPLMDACARARG